MTKFCLEVVPATFLQVRFVSVKESTCEARKMFFISLRKRFPFLRFNFSVIQM